MHPRVGVFLIAFCSLGAVAPSLSAQDLPQLVEALKSSDAAAREKAAMALGDLGPKAAAAVAELTARLKDESPAVRAHAAFALGQIGAGANSAVPALGAAVKDSEPAVRRAAIGALRSIHPAPEVIFPLMADVLNTSDPATVGSILQAIAESGAQEGYPMLVKALQNEATRFWAAVIMADYGVRSKEALPALIEALSDNRPHVRQQVLLALAAVGPDAAPAAPAITQQLAGTESSVKYAAAFALGQIGPAAAAAEQQLSAQLAGKDEFLRMISAWALARIHPENVRMKAQAVNLLMQGLKNPEPRHRMAAAQGLLALKPGSEVVVPAMIEALQSNQPELAGLAVAALAETGAPAVPRLAEALKDPACCLPAAAALGRIGPAAKPAVAALLPLLKDENPAVRREVLLALGAIGPPAESVLDSAVSLLDDPDPKVRTAAAYVLGKLGPAAKSAAPALRKGLASGDPGLNRIAAWALVKIEPENQENVRAAIPVLTEALAHEQAMVRREAADALRALGAQSRPALEALQRLANDPDPAVKAAAEEAIKAIGQGN
ncbi:MAG: HEAT repeat domain-containing protein [Planctomycetes bacterium]|nr:HEAT repeat domain-containing protein [Planctomycetota bacterium]